jgi:circadian clock protein KaiC
MSQTRTHSGIPELDALIEGGFPRNRSVLICGDTGAGKTTLGLQFLAEGARRGEAGVFVAVDEKPRHLIEDARRFGWDLAAASEQKVVTVLDASPYFTARAGKHGLDARQVASDLAQQARGISAQRLVIDSLTSLVPHEASPLRVYDFLRALVFSLEDNLGCTVLLIARTCPGQVPSEVCQTAELLASGIVHLRMAPLLGRSLFVQKMRGTCLELHEHPFDILDGQGIVLHPDRESRPKQNGNHEKKIHSKLRV